MEIRWDDASGSAPTIATEFADADCIPASGLLARGALSHVNL
jgi:hypothetical protein